jgi:hypothetical protein
LINQKRFSKYLLCLVQLPQSKRRRKIIFPLVFVDNLTSLIIAQTINLVICFPSTHLIIDISITDINYVMIIIAQMSRRKQCRVLSRPQITIHPRSQALFLAVLEKGKEQSLGTRLFTISKLLFPLSFTTTR